MFILDWDAVVRTGDNVAVPALGQSNFLLLVFSLIFVPVFLLLDSSYNLLGVYLS